MGKPDFGTSGDLISNRTKELPDPKGLTILTKITRHQFLHISLDWS